MAYAPQILEDLAGFVRGSLVQFLRIYAGRGGDVGYNGDAAGIFLARSISGGII